MEFGVAFWYLLYLSNTRPIGRQSLPLFLTLTSLLPILGHGEQTERFPLPSRKRTRGEKVALGGIVSALARVSIERSVTRSKLHVGLLKISNGRNS